MSAITNSSGRSVNSLICLSTGFGILLLFIPGFDTPIFGSDATVAGLDFDLIKDSLAVILVGLQRW